jgi:hypothetical protein
LVGAGELDYLAGYQGWAAVCREGRGGQEDCEGEELVHFGVCFRKRLVEVEDLEVVGVVF